MRALADATQKHLGQPIVIENQAGASGTLGPAQMAATAKPDGYTIAQIPITVFRLPFMTKTTFDPDQGLHLCRRPHRLHVRRGGARAIRRGRRSRNSSTDAKANPGKIKYGTPGTGTSLHIGMEQIAKQTGVKWTHVPFKGAAETNAALLGGHVDAVADSTGWGALVEFR